MGDMSELRGLVLIASFIGCLFMVIGLMPSQILQAASVNPQSPSLGNTLPDLWRWNSSYIHNFTDQNSHEFEVNGWTLGFSAVYNIFGLSPGIIGCTVQYGWFPWQKTYVMFHWHYTNGTERDPWLRITWDELEADYENNESMTYNLKNEQVSIMVTVAWNTTLYSTPLLAMENNGLSLVFNTVPNYDATSMNGYQFILTLLSPWGGISGLPEWINYVLKAGLWAAMAYFLFIFVLRVIGSVFGGGGA